MRIMEADWPLIDLCDEQHCKASGQSRKMEEKQQYNLSPVDCHVGARSCSC